MNKLNKLAMNRIVDDVLYDKLNKRYSTDVIRSITDAVCEELINNGLDFVEPHEKNDSYCGGIS